MEREHRGISIEWDVFEKLQDSEEILQLKADNLMFHHVYADLTMLSKSNDLNLSAFSMNMHYLELSTYLGEVKSNPSIVLDQAYHVFLSEDRVYGTEKTNHRTKPQWTVLY